jgi:rubrerythrin
MSISLKLNDVFDMAVHIEQNGARFYRQAAARDGVAETTTSMLAELAVMEDDHEQIFVAMKEGRPEGTDKPAFASDNDTVAYLHAITDGNLIGGDSAETTRTAEQGTTTEILRTAIELEKDSIVFYLGLREILTKEADKEKVDGVIREEMRHIVDLQTKLETL